MNEPQHHESETNTLRARITHLEAELARDRDEQRQLRALIGISRAINRTLDPGEVAEAGLRETVHAMHAEAGAIWLFDASGHSLSLAHSVGVPAPVRKALLAVNLANQPIVAEAVLSGKAVQFDVSIDDPHLGEYKSALLVPLNGRHGSVGVLAVGSRRELTFADTQLGFVGAVAEHLAAALDHAFEHRREAHTDYLTGLANLSEFVHAVSRQLAAARRHRRPLTLLLMDIDELKRINDTHGHHAGDEAIRSVAEVIRAAVRTSDVSARLGGDEFGVAMPEADLEQAREVAARVQQALHERSPAAGLPSALELSFGLAQWEPGMDYAALFEAADRLLYRDKRRHQAGRARLRAAGTLRESKGSSAPTSSPVKPSR